MMKKSFNPTFIFVKISTLCLYLYCLWFLVNYDTFTSSRKAGPHKKSIAILKEKLKRLTNRSWSVSWEYRILKIRQLVVGWINYYRIENLWVYVNK